MPEYNETIQQFARSILESNNIDTSQFSKLAQQFIKDNTDIDNAFKRMTKLAENALSIANSQQIVLDDQMYVPDNISESANNIVESIEALDIPTNDAIVKKPKWKKKEIHDFFLKFLFPLLLVLLPMAQAAAYHVEDQKQQEEQSKQNQKNFDEILEYLDKIASYLKNK